MKFAACQSITEQPFLWWSKLNLNLRNKSAISEEKCQMFIKSYGVTNLDDTPLPSHTIYIYNKILYVDKRILLIPTSIYFLGKEFVESVTRQPAESITNQCVTDNTNSSCILPFKVDGILHDRCLPDLNTGKYWCPTSVNQEQEYVAGTSKWGFCSQSCPPLNEKFGNTIKWHKLTSLTKWECGFRRTHVV